MAAIPIRPEPRVEAEAAPISEGRSLLTAADVVPLLVNQAIYLFAQSKQKEEAELEYRNLDRIVALLLNPSARSGSNDIKQVLAVLPKNANGQSAGGLPLNQERIDGYRDRMEGYLAQLAQRSVLARSR
jgi:hypothetical protein